MRSFLMILFSLIVIVTAVCSLQPASAQTMRELNACRDLKADPDVIIKACSVFARTRRAVGGRPAPASALSAIFMLRGGAYIRKGEPDRAIEDFDEAARINPKNGSAYHEQGVAHFMNREYERAIADFTRAISIPNTSVAHSESYYNRALIYITLRDSEHALADLNQAVHLNPKYAPAYRNLGTVYGLLLGDNTRAVAAYNTAEQLDPAAKQMYEDARELEAHWVAYLKEIQSENDYGNWSGPPLDMFLRTTVASSASFQSSTVAAPDTAPTDVSCAQAAVHWKSVEDIRTVAAYEDHLARFPNCAFATLARARIAALTEHDAPGKTGGGKACPAGMIADPDGDCVRDKKTEKRKAPSRRTSERPAQSNEGGLASSVLNCANSTDILACANRALSTLPVINGNANR